MIVEVAQAKPMGCALRASSVAAFEVAALTMSTNKAESVKFLNILLDWRAVVRFKYLWRLQAFEQWLYIKKKIRLILIFFCRQQILPIVDYYRRPLVLDGHAINSTKRDIVSKFLGFLSSALDSTNGGRFPINTLCGCFPQISRVLYLPRRRLHTMAQIVSRQLYRLHEFSHCGGSTIKRTFRFVSRSAYNILNIEFLLRLHNILNIASSCSVPETSNA